VKVTQNGDGQAIVEDCCAYDEPTTSVRFRSL